jgi:hypothetical protein
MPVEAAGLMKQLKDSETGKAQREKGDGLDIVVPEGVDQLDLQEGVSYRLHTDIASVQTDERVACVIPGSLKTSSYP